LPKNISLPTKKVGEPNAPRSTAAWVFSISFAFTSGNAYLGDLSQFMLRGFGKTWDKDFLLGGTVGLGTLLYATAIGPITHVTIPRLAIGRRGGALHVHAPVDAPDGSGDVRRLVGREEVDDPRDLIRTSEAP